MGDVTAEDLNYVRGSLGLPESGNAITRAWHLRWAKERALEELEHSGAPAAFNSLISDLSKHPETADHPAMTLGVTLLVSGHLNSEQQMRDFIEGMN